MPFEVCPTHRTTLGSQPYVPGGRDETSLRLTGMDPFLSRKVRTAISREKEVRRENGPSSSLPHLCNAHGRLAAPLTGLESRSLAPCGAAIETRALFDCY